MPSPQQPIDQQVCALVDLPEEVPVENEAIPVDRARLASVLGDKKRMILTVSFTFL